ncbi:MAG: zinc-binding alcohol dehydrogenase family protein [Actinomycetota bacterium]
MRAIGYTTPGPFEVLEEFDLDRPVPAGHDLLVEVAAVSVNPVDDKTRAGRPPLTDGPAVLGWDAVGVVAEVGEQCDRFGPGDRVWYAGDYTRQGSNAEFHLVDERIVGRAPSTVTDAEAAALPLTALTAWEGLFDRLQVDEPIEGAGPAVVVIGGAGGVGSIAIQLLRARTDYTVIATASRPETRAWVTDLGAHHVIDHRQPLPGQIDALGLGQPGFVFSTTHTRDYLAAIAEFMSPQGRFGFIDRFTDFDVSLFFPKCISIHPELMFTRSMQRTADIARQGAILDELAGLVDGGQVRSTMTESFGPITADNLRRAHARIATGAVLGKIVLEGF